MAPQPPASLWRHPDFLKLWAAQTVSAFGSQFTALAIPVVAALLLGATPAQMGLLTAVTTGPYLLFALAGVWVDRWPRRRVLIAADVGRAAVLLAVPALALADRLAMVHLYAVGFCASLFTVFFDTADQAYLPALVSRQRLVEANSRLETTRSLARLVGPGAAGAVVQVLGAPLAVLTNVGSFLVSAVLLGLIRGKESPPDPTERKPLWTELRRGLEFVLRNPYLRAIAPCTGSFNLVASAAEALLVLFATRELGLSPAALGAAFSVANVGALAGALAASRVAGAVGLGRAIVGGSALSGLWLVPLALATPSTAFPMVALAGALAGLGGAVYNINQVSLRQSITPLPLQGRVNGTMRFLVWGTMPAGGLLGGLLGQAVGIRPALTLLATLQALTFLWVAASPVAGLRAVPSAEA
ncbi:Enterobactin exporter EntS [bacterium HR32]|jgi:MFS family permease|nr:Enterobactin exporter EntS [bacterium HR32]